VIPPLKAQMTICSKNLWGTYGLLGLSATHMPAGKEAAMSELQAQLCMTPEQ